MPFLPELARPILAGAGLAAGSLLSGTSVMGASPPAATSCNTRHDDPKKASEQQCQFTTVNSPSGQARQRNQPLSWQVEEHSQHNWVAVACQCCN